MSDHANGAHRAQPLPEAPAEVVDLAEGCVRFVERALGVRLDFTPETLGLLDHYIRTSPRDPPDVAALLVLSAGAYLGEVVRRRYTCWWQKDGRDDVASFRIAFEPVFVAFSPFELVRQALEHAEMQDDLGVLELDDDDRTAVAERLAELPAVGDDEFYSLATRVEVIDIAIEAIRARRIAAGEPADALLGPDDYA